MQASRISPQKSEKTYNSRPDPFLQAEQACALAGKRLLTNQEWQRAAASTPDGAPCNVGGTPGLTGTAGCVSAWGAFDMVGNVSEWVANWVPPATTCSTDLFGTADLNCMAIDPTTFATPRPSNAFDFMGFRCVY